MAREAFANFPEWLKVQLQQLYRAAKICGCGNCKKAWEDACEKYGRDV